MAQRPPEVWTGWTHVLVQERQVVSLGAAAASAAASAVGVCWLPCPGPAWPAVEGRSAQTWAVLRLLMASNPRASAPSNTSAIHENE